MRKILDICEIVLIALIYFGGLVTKDWNYCYIATLFLIIVTLNDILREIKNK